MMEEVSGMLILYIRFIKVSCMRIHDVCPYMSWVINKSYIMMGKSQSAKEACHQPALMGSCLTISHTCLPCLSSGSVSPCVPGVIKGSEDAASL